MEEYAVFIGIDWADTKHDVCIVDVRTDKRSASTIEHTPQALDAWVQNLRAKHRSQKIAVCLEQSRGALIFALLKYDFLVLYPVNPQTLAKIRQAFATSRAKDDPSDAAFLVELLQKHRDRLRVWLPNDEETRRLQFLVEHRRRLVNDSVRFEHRLEATLKLYFPQILSWFSDIGSELVCAFLLAWPTPEKLKAESLETIHSFFHEHHCYRQERIEARLAEIQKLVPACADFAVIATSAFIVQSLLDQIRVTQAAIRRVEKEIARLAESHQDVILFSSFPGAGSALAPRIAVAFGSDRSRFSQAGGLP